MQKPIVGDFSYELQGEVYATVPSTINSQGEGMVVQCQVKDYHHPVARYALLLVRVCGGSGEATTEAVRWFNYNGAFPLIFGIVLLSFR